MDQEKFEKAEQLRMTIRDIDRMIKWCLEHKDSKVAIQSWGISSFCYATSEDRKLKEEFVILLKGRKAELEKEFMQI